MELEYNDEEDKEMYDIIGNFEQVNNKAENIGNYIGNKVDNIPHAEPNTNPIPMFLLVSIGIGSLIGIIIFCLIKLQIENLMPIVNILAILIGKQPDIKPIRSNRFPHTSDLRELVERKTYYGLLGAGEEAGDGF